MYIRISGKETPMPTGRFLNLSQEKQNRILIASAAEFARVPYEKVSINKIIKAAEIPRGSFYQYFSGKQDLLEHIMKGFRGKLMSTAGETLKLSGGDPFAVFPALMELVFNMAECFYDPELFRNIYSCVSAYRMQSFEFFRIDTGEILESYGHLIAGSPFDALPPETKRDVLEILITLLHNAIERRFIENIPAEASLNEFNRKINIIKNCALLKGVNK